MKKLLPLIIISISLIANSQVLVKDIEPGAAPSTPQEFYPFKDKFVFVAYTNFYKFQLYITDGTSSGTKQLTTTINNYPASYYGLTSSDQLSLANLLGTTINTDIDSLLFFFCKNSTGKINIWKTNGTVNGTNQITSDNDNLGIGTRFFKLNSKICTIIGNKLFKYDPISNNYSLLLLSGGGFFINQNYKDVAPTPFVYNNKIYFRNFNSPDSIFSLDVNCTKQFVNKMPFNWIGGGQNNTSNYMIINNKLIINPGSSAGSIYGDEPFYYDFVSNTKGLLKDINSYFNYSSNPKFLKFSYFHKSSMNVGYFYAENPDDGREIYFTDGTASGTRLTRNLAVGNNSIYESAYYNDFEFKGDSLIFLNNLDSLRILYKDQFYKAYRYYNPNPINSSATASHAFSNFIDIGNKIYFNGWATSSWNNNTRNRIFRMDKSYSIDSLNYLNCSISQQGFGGNFGNSIFLKKDSCYYFTEQICTTGLQTGNELFKFCNNSMYFVGINDITALQQHVSVFPNPSTSQFNFNGLVGENTLYITDITGRVLRTEKTFSDSYTIKLDAAQGIYFYKITDKQNRVQQGKLILQ